MPNEQRTISDIWIYTLYILLACAVTSALNVVHTKYVLQRELLPVLFVVPILAGVIFGYATAKIRTSKNIIIYQSDFRIFLHYILMSCVVTAALNIIHTEWVLGRELEPVLFIAPTIAGIFFGYLLAKIKTLNNKLTKMATTDMLTGAYNRMHFENMLDMEIDNVRRHGGTFSIVFFDVDNFKYINDDFGHQSGDKVLAELSEIIRSKIRVSDIFFRYGGEEFIVMSLGSDKPGATILAETLCNAIQQHQFCIGECVTCSFGVTEYGGQERDNLIEEADKALYMAKDSGRNCVQAI